MKNRISVGISSIVLIFLILCLAVFSLLSLSDAKTALEFSRRRAASVVDYYEADKAGQIFLRDFSAAFELSGDITSAADEAAKQLPSGSSVSRIESGAVLCEIPMAAGRALQIELDDSGSLFSYHVYNSVEYVIDTELPVWGADEFP